MDYQKAIESLRLEGEIEISGKPRRVAKFFDGLDVAISAMQELQELKVSDDNLNDHIQELKQAKYDIETFWEESTALSRAMQRAINALLEVKLYKQFGTPEEVREAVEKQNKKHPTYDGDGYAPDGTFVWDEWLCPKCGTRYEVDYDDYDYCPNCGQRINWSEEE